MRRRRNADAQRTPVAVSHFITLLRTKPTASGWFQNRARLASGARKRTKTDNFLVTV
jgi:hypothetical protein